MSIVDRLFPASELEVLRASPYDFELAPATKRRKLSSTPSVVDSQARRTSSDSGYSSDESSPILESWLSSRKRSRSSTSSASSQTSTSTQFAQSALFKKYLSAMDPVDRTQFQLRAQSTSSVVTPADLKDFYQQITLARSRSRSSISGMPTPPYSNGGSTTHLSPYTVDEGIADDEAESCVQNVGQGWTAGPKSAPGLDLSARIFDGIRLTTQERSMLHSLMPGLSVPQDVPSRPILVTNPTFTYPQRRESQISVPAPPPAQSSFAGIAIGSWEDDEEESEEQDLDGFTLESEGTGKVEDFFNIEEACDDSPADTTDE